MPSQKPTKTLQQLNTYVVLQMNPSLKTRPPPSPPQSKESREAAADLCGIHHFAGGGSQGGLVALDFGTLGLGSLGFRFWGAKGSGLITYQGLGLWRVWGVLGFV